MPSGGGSNQHSIAMPRSPILDVHPDFSHGAAKSNRSIAEGDRRRRNNRRTSRRKMTCIFLLILLGIAFLAAIIVVSVRQGYHSHHKENEEEVQQFQGPEFIATTTTTTTILSSISTTDQINLGDFLERSAKRFYEVNQPESAQNLIQEEKWLRYYGDFDFRNVTNEDLKYTYEFVKNQSNPDSDRLTFARLSVDPRIARVADALSTHIRQKDDLDSSGRKLHIPHVLIFEKPMLEEDKMTEMMENLDKLLKEVTHLPEDIEPDEDVLQYLNITGYNSTFDSASVSETIIDDPQTVLKDIVTSQFAVKPTARMSVCSTGEHVCGLNRSECYSEEQRCDNVMDCSDLSDEISCSKCLNFFRAGPERDAVTCDGYFDCLNGEDEENCGKCGFGQFQCGTDENYEPICISESKRCDFYEDCPNAADEIGCISLWPEDLSIENDIAASIYTDGILHWKLNGQWVAVSISREDKDVFIKMKGREICSQVLLHGEGSLSPDHKFTYSFMNETTFKKSAHLLVNSVFLEMDTEYKFHLGFQPNDAVYVNLDCGSIKCGSRPYADKAEGNVDDFFKSRIVGGTESRPFDWPSVVGIYINGNLLCGGTLIHSNWVISAAHCFKNADKDTVVEIAAGMARLKSRSPYTQVRQIQHVFSHGNFNKSFLTNDVSLLYFEDPVIFNAKVNLACINDNEALPKVGERCMTVGWGSTSENDNEVNNELLEVEVPIKKYCIQGYNDVTHQICGGFGAGGKDACQGDSGGPLYCSKDGNDDYANHYLAGIVSHGIGCARAETDGVYVRLTYFKDWIDRILSLKENLQTHSRSKRESLSIHDLIKEKYPDLAVNFVSISTQCSSGVRCDGGRCIQSSDVCDGKFDCMDRSDELDCKFDHKSGKRYHEPGYWNDIRPIIFLTTTTQSTTTSVQVTTAMPPQNMSVHLKPEKCGEEFFTCQHIHECISLSQKCDFNKDCLDGSDEVGCSCLQYIQKGDGRICDGIPDCPDWSDERNCQYCPEPDDFYCDISHTCIPNWKVCDRTIDCEFKEDERYCIAIIPNSANNEIQLHYGNDSRPLRHTHGYVALNQNGAWAPVCVDENSWTSEINDRICRYQGSVKSDGFDFVPSENVPDPQFLKNPLTVYYPPEFESFTYERRKWEDSTSELTFCNSGVIRTSCSDTFTCGIHPRYRTIDDYEIFNDLNLEGLFPWQVTLYQEGQYVCGATLIHRNWIMTSVECSSKMDPKRNYVLARMGAYRNGRFLSPREQLHQVIQFTVVPHTGISLGTFQHAVTLNEYVNPICIPSSNWFPFGGKCVITGFDQDEGILNKGVKMTVSDICEINAVHDYSVCTELVDETDVCMKDWAGTLACKDSSDRYYVLGTYYSENGGCLEGLFDTNRRHEVPLKFRSVSTATARDAIKKIVSVFSANESVWYNGEDGCKTHRCPLGRCLKPSQLCDGVADCEDMTDESFEFCKTKVTPCLSYNNTHCLCDEDQFMCKRTGVCVNRNKFCDGYDDCGDGSDEPEDCNQCSKALEVLNPSALCDGHIDCLDTEDSVGSDESFSQCCPLYGDGEGTFRCVLGTIKFGKYDNIDLIDQCIPESGICDFCNSESTTDCSNGADDIDCLSFWPRKGGNDKDVFGRPDSQPQGYVHFVAYGKRYLYCAGEDLYSLLENDQNVKNEAAKILCDHEGYENGYLTFHETVEMKYMYDSDDKTHCKLLYIVCEDHKRAS